MYIIFSSNMIENIFNKLKHKKEASTILATALNSANCLHTLHPTQT